MLNLASGMDAGELAAVADLERRVVDVDGGRLKLEWGALRSPQGTDPFARGIPGPGPDRRRVPAPCPFAHPVATYEAGSAVVH